MSIVSLYVLSSRVVVVELELNVILPLLIFFVRVLSPAADVAVQKKVDPSLDTLCQCSCELVLEPPSSPADANVVSSSSTPTNTLPFILSQVPPQLVEGLKELSNVSYTVPTG